MTDLQRGDHVEVSYRGEITYVSANRVWAEVVPEGTYRTCAVPIKACTKIDPPVKVGDEIEYSQAIRLPRKSTVLGLKSGSAYQVYETPRGVLDLYFGLLPINYDGKQQTFRVLDIKEIS